MSIEAVDGFDGLELVADLGAELGEGPVWDPRSGRVMWVDIVGRYLHATDPASGETESSRLPSHVGAVAVRSAGGFVAALQDGMWVIGDGPARQIAAIAHDDPATRFNDGKCDPAGRFWAGTMPYDEVSPVGALYRIDHDGSATRMVDGVTISNGLAWSRDGATMFYIDSPTRRIDAFAFDVATGELTDRRTVVEVASGMGSPDGMTIDAEDGLWVAFWGGGAVRRFVGGRLDREIRLPVSQPTSCAFGGQDLDEMYITSAWKGMTTDDRRAELLAGSLLRVRPGVGGVESTAFGAA